MRRLLTRWHPTYPRTLTYMLQASDYRVGEYFAWLRRVSNFQRVAVRKQLDFTVKARLLVGLLWACWLALLAGFAALVTLAAGNNPLWLLLAVPGLVFSPWLLAYVIVGPLQLGRVLIQKPVERRMVRRATTQLIQHPATKVAIAGSYGKTTFKENLAAVLKTARRTAVTPGNRNTPIGVSRFVETLRGDEEVLIFEFGEYYPGDIRELAELVRPDIGVITGVNEAHLEKFQTLDRTTATVFELADFLGEKPVYVNAESDHAKGAARSSHQLYSRKGCGDWRVSDAATRLEGTSFTLHQGKQRLPIKTALLGLHQIGPLTAAVAIASALGLDSRRITEDITSIKPFDHRLAPRRESGGVVILDDSYNGNPDGVRAAIEFLRTLSGHRRIFVTPGLVEMGSRATAVHHDIGRQLATATEVVVLIRNSVTSHIAAGLKEANFKGELIWYDDAPLAHAAISGMLKAGDVVLFQNDWPDNYA